MYMVRPCRYEIVQIAEFADAMVGDDTLPQLYDPWDGDFSGSAAGFFA